MTPTENAARFEAEIRSWAAEVWNLEDENLRWDLWDGWTILHPTPSIREDERRMQHTNALRPALEESLRRLRLRWPDGKLNMMAADTYFNNDDWWRRFERYDPYRILVERISGACVFEYPPARPAGAPD
jgi:hypothetical protein